MKKLLIILILCSGCTVTPGYRQFQVIESNTTILTDFNTGRVSGVIHETVPPFRKWYFEECRQLEKYSKIKWE